MKKILSEFNFSEAEHAAVRSLAQKCGLHELTAGILFSRGADTPEKVRRFLSPSRKNFVDPFLMRGMRELVGAVGEIKEKDGLIVVYGDYDADGIGAASILSRALTAFGVRCVAYVPERADGYGMSVSALEKIIDKYAPDLIVTVDCGVSNREEAEYIKSRGVRVIVTDHHELPDVLPDCVVINPKISDEYPYDNLCGAGVAFKVACALLGEEAYGFADIAAVSTVADSVPLTGENRDIVFEGLKLINEGHRQAISLLASSKKGEITAQTLAFTVAPRINAAGRMGDADSALRLFASDDAGEVYDLACKLNEYNLERQQACDEVYRSAKEMIAREGPFRNVIMLCGEEWSTGLVGIVAAKLSEEFNRPALLFVPKGGVLKGSARTIENVNIYEALRACSAYIEEFGGHAQAAGVNVLPENFGKLRDALDAYLGEKYGKEDFMPSLCVSGTDVCFDLALAEELERLEPCGVGNRRPLFAAELARTDARRMKDGSPHITMQAEGTELVWFGGEKALPLLASDMKKTVVFECGVSCFRGKASVRGIVRDMVCSYGEGELTRLYVFRNNLLRLAEKEPSAVVCFEPEEELRGRIAAARRACNYGMLAVCSESIPAPFAECLRGLDVDLFRPGSHNVGNAVLVSPAADADVSMYRDVFFLDRPADFNIAALDGKKVVVNSELCGYNSIAGLETSRGVMGELYCAMRGGVKGEDSVAFAASAGLPFDARQVVFAAEVFLELGLLRPERGRLVAVPGKKTDLRLSAIYRGVCALKEGRG